MLIELHREVVEREASATGEARAFESGRRLALYEALSTLHSQILAFGLDPAKCGFPKDFNADSLA